MATISLVEYDDLVANGPSAQAAILRAFGDNPECMGIILVRNVPGYRDLRQKLLPLSNALVKLPQQALEDMALPEYSYQFGWSHGKEKFGGKPGTIR